MKLHVALIVACVGAAMPGTLARAEIAYGVTSTHSLVTWDSSAPGAILTGVAISGLALNETIHGIDFRPATGQLYALGSFSNLYTINPATGAASLVGAGSFSPGLNGSAFGFDFNPVIDRIRVVSDANQNMVLNPDTGAVQLNATALFYDASDPNAGKDPNVAGSAYTNNFAGAPSTQLFGIDTGLDILVKQANNTGVLTTVGSLGGDIATLVGFDISGLSGIAYAASLNAGGSVSTFWTINLNTGAATPIGQIGGGTIITSMTMAVPAPSTGVLLSLGALAALKRRRRSA